MLAQGTSSPYKTPVSPTITSAAPLFQCECASSTCKFSPPALARDSGEAELTVAIRFRQFWSNLCWWLDWAQLARECVSIPSWGRVCSFRLGRRSTYLVVFHSSLLCLNSFSRTDHRAIILALVSHPRSIIQTLLAVWLFLPTAFLFQYQSLLTWYGRSLLPPS